MKAIAALGHMAGGMEKDAALRYAAAGDASRRLVDAVERVSRRFDGLASTADARQAALKIHELWGGDDQLEAPDRPASETAIASDEESGEPVKVIDTGVARDVGIAELLERELSEFRRLLDERGGSSDDGVSGETMGSGVSYEADRTRDKVTVVPTTPRPDTEGFHREVRALVGQLARRLFQDLLAEVRSGPGTASPGRASIPERSIGWRWTLAGSSAGA